MRIYVSHSSGFDFVNELYVPLKAWGLGTDHELILPHEAGADPTHSKELIAGSDLVLAEVSYPSTGQGIELGWADAAGVRIVCIYRAGSRVSSSLQLVAHKMLEYQSVEAVLTEVGSDD